VTQAVANELVALHGRADWSAGTVTLQVSDPATTTGVIQSFAVAAAAVGKRRVSVAIGPQTASAATAAAQDYYVLPDELHRFSRFQRPRAHVNTYETPPDMAAPMATAPEADFTVPPIPVLADWQPGEKYRDWARHCLIVLGNTKGSRGWLAAHIAWCVTLLESSAGYGFRKFGLNIGATNWTSKDPEGAWFEHKDHDAKGKEVMRRFQAFEKYPLAQRTAAGNAHGWALAAKSLFRLLDRMGVMASAGSQNREPTEADFQKAATLMYQGGYYTMTKGTPEDRIGVYAGRLAQVWKHSLPIRSATLIPHTP
jgi:hypothetical protein